MEARELLDAYLVMRDTGVPPWAFGVDDISRSRLWQVARMMAPALSLTPTYVAYEGLKLNARKHCPLIGGS